MIAHLSGGLDAMMAERGYDELVDDGASTGGPYAGVVCAAVADADADTVEFTATMLRGGALTATVMKPGMSLPGPFNVVTKTGGTGKLLLVRP